MYSYENKANMAWSTANMFAVCSSCAKSASESSVNSIFGTVLMAVPFFVLSAIICLGIININIIAGLLIALTITGLVMQCCHVSETKSPAVNTGA